MKSKFTRLTLAASSLVLVMQVGLVSPASAATITSNVTSVAPGEAATLSSDIDLGTVIAVFLNGEFVVSEAWDMNPADPVPWEAIAPCVTIDVTFRVYDEGFVGTNVKNFADPYEDSVTIQWIGDNTVDCNPAWGEGDREPEDLAKTGSDSSTLVGLTGVAGVAALAVAVAVARRTRRAQR
jgi:LPXTG-motif cell wall-anchored protein